MITIGSDYFEKGCGRCDRFASADCSVQQWQLGLKKLRQICLEIGLHEEVKWGHPCYTYKGRNIAILGAFRKDFRLSFFNAALLKDSQKILIQQGPNSQHPDCFKLSHHQQIDALAATIQAYLLEAISYAEQGVLLVKEKSILELPQELLDFMNLDEELAQAFKKLSPGRQKSYVLQINSAKQLTTKITRIKKFRPTILAGKGANEL
jgi:uncharacterized protein YdeI (YjbR/CyaY-like superfamily)